MSVSHSLSESARRDAASETADDIESRRLSAVHPADWKNPVASGRYHLVVIGAGTAGLVSAAGAAGLGARVALIERDLMGGDCLNVGCVPSKGIIAASRQWANARAAQADFHGPATSGDGDFAAVMHRMRKLRADIAPVDGAARFRALGVDVYFGDAAFTTPDTISVAGQTLRFRRAVIATGARVAAPDIPGLKDVEYLTNESVFEIDTRPQHLIVLGGGPIGCELAQAFARLGSQVTLLDRGPRILPRDDKNASDIVQRALEHDGVRVVCNADISRVERGATDGGAARVHYTAAGQSAVAEGDRLLVAAGRAPNVEGLGLDVANIAYTRQGVTVSDQLRTTNSRVFACGDVCSRLQFTHAADFQARTVIQNALFFGRKRASELVIPWTTYTSPEVAHVGHTPDSAREAGVAIQTFTVPLQDVDRAILDGETTGFVRVHLGEGTDRIVGATIVANNAGDLIAEYTLCMTNRLGLSAIGSTIHPYPTQGDAVRKTADAWRKTRLTPTVRSLFKRWFRWFA